MIRVSFRQKLSYTIKIDFICRRETGDLVHFKVFDWAKVFRLSSVLDRLCGFISGPVRRLLSLMFLADRTNGRAYATVLRPSVCRRRLSVTLCIVAKQCVLEQKLLLRAYRKSYMRNRLVPK